MKAQASSDWQHHSTSTSTRPHAASTARLGSRQSPLDDLQRIRPCSNFTEGSFFHRWMRLLQDIRHEVVTPQSTRQPRQRLRLRRGVGELRPPNQESTSQRTTQNWRMCGSQYVLVNYAEQWKPRTEYANDPFRAKALGVTGCALKPDPSLSRRGPSPHVSGWRESSATASLPKDSGHNWT